VIHSLKNSDPVLSKRL